MAPGRRDEHNKQSAGHCADFREPGNVVQVQDFDRQSQEGKVLTGQLEHAGVQFETQSLRARKVTQQPVEGIAGAGKRIDDDGLSAARGYGGDVLGDRAAERIASALK